MPRRTSAPTLEKPVLDDASKAPRKVGFVSLGCPKNLVDSEIMMGMLAQSGDRKSTRLNSSH